MNVKLVVISMFCLLPMTAFGENPLKFGMAPTMGPLAMEQIFGRLARKFEEILGEDVAFKTRKTSEDFNEAFAVGEFDIVMMHPFTFLSFDIQSDYLPVVRKKGDLTPIFVAIDKNIESVEDLNGKVVGFPSSGEFLSKLGKQFLRQHGLQNDNFIEQQYGDFNSCLHSIVNSSVQACLSIRNLVKEFTRDNSLQFHEIGVTDPVPHVVIFIRRSMQDKLQNLQQQLLALNTSEEGRIFLNFLLLDELEAIDIQQLEQMKHHTFFKTNK